MIAHDEVYREIERSFGASVSLRTAVPATELTTFGLGANIPSLFEPRDTTALAELIKFLSTRGIPWRVIGAGSNVILPDCAGDFSLIRLGRSFSRVLSCDTVDDLLSLLSSENEASEAPLQELLEAADGAEISLLAFAGVSLMNLSRKVSLAGFSGLEFAAGIPASLGGATVMNAGAHGSQMSEVITRVVTLDSSGELQVLGAEDLAFSYRASAISADQVVVATELRLVRADKEEINTRRRECLDYRKNTQPLHLPSAGSVFTNPSANQFAAQLLEAVGLKGQTVGGVSYSTMHANWLVRTAEQACAADAAALIERGQQAVESSFGVLLEQEIILW